MDSIGKLFGEFLKYTVQMATENGKVLTPSYISHLMEKLIHVKDTDEVLDVYAGSGGMLVAAYDEMRSSNPGFQLKKDQLRRIEINPRMAALAVSNMILRGISYKLGRYIDKEDAKRARKMAEEAMFGNFLKWFQDTYPDRWKRMTNTDSSKMK